MNLDREEFRQALKAEFLARTPLAPSEADMYATATLEALEAFAGGFGADGYDWDVMAAREAVDAELLEWAEN